MDVVLITFILSSNKYWSWFLLYNLPGFADNSSNVQIILQCVFFAIVMFVIGGFSEVLLHGMEASDEVIEKKFWFTGKSVDFCC